MIRACVLLMGFAVFTLAAFHGNAVGMLLSGCMAIGAIVSDDGVAEVFADDPAESDTDYLTRTATAEALERFMATDDVDAAVARLEADLTAIATERTERPAIIPLHDWQLPQSAILYLADYAGVEYGAIDVDCHTLRGDPHPWITVRFPGTESVTFACVSEDTGPMLARRLEGKLAKLTDPFDHIEYVSSKVLERGGWRDTPYSNKQPSGVLSDPQNPPRNPGRALRQ